MQQAGLFRGLDQSDRPDVVQTARRRATQRDAFFFHQGDQATALYVLIQGRVRIAQVRPEGQQVTVRIVSPGETFGGIAALGDTAYPASAQALEASVVLMWDSDTMARLMEENQ